MSKACWHPCVHLKRVFFFVSSYIGTKSNLSLGKKELRKLTMPQNWYTSLTDFGGLRFSIASHLSFIGV